VNSRIPITIFEVRQRKEATNAGVIQDKSGFIRDRAASGQPERTPDEIRSNQNRVQSLQSNTSTTQRSHTTGIHSTPINYTDVDGPLVPLTIHIPKSWKAEIQRIAVQDGLSDSSTARAFLGRGMQANIDMQYGAMIKPIIEHSLHDNFQSYNNRNANIGLQAYYAAEQARILAIHTLRFLTDLVDSPDELHVIITTAQEEAWKHMENLNRDKKEAKAAKEDYRTGHMNGDKAEAKAPREDYREWQS
jgi:hypothetical protein